ncbi:MAG: single-stranded-DNA-specific exonuclease RecJ, partial [Lachnospiraceae bacterium]|nr:single-stranded-DNA-specific exonuclease RecJ [Lachnospiraceae bacterium]
SELLLKYGGHPMAAGMSLSRDNVEKFRKALNDNCTLTEEQLTEKCWIDIPLPVSAITLDWLQELDILEPFGNGNEKPAFACANLTLLRVSIIGRNKNVLKLTFREEQGFVFEAMMFHGMDDFLTDLLRNYGTKVKDDLLRGRPDALAPVKMSIMYEPGINVFRDVRSIQIVIRDYHM